ncbi:MAG: MBL fold metallo-hydrolase [Psychrobacillus sp.]
MKIDLTFLGTGSAFSKVYGNNSAVLTIANGPVVKRMMIDCGRTTPDDLHASQFDLGDIDAIFITHLHGDHVYGLEEMGFYGRYVLNRKPHLVLPTKEMKYKLWHEILKGTMEEGDLDRPMSFDDYFTCEIVDEKEQYFLFNDCMISVYNTEHIENKESYGLIISEYDYIVYTSDSLFNEDFIKSTIKDGAQAIFHDCQMVDYEGKVHASLSEIESLPNKYKRKIHIMHYGDDLTSYYDRIKGNYLNIASKCETYSFLVK